MKKLILLSLVLLPFMSTILDAGAPPPGEDEKLQNLNGVKLTIEQQRTLPIDTEILVDQDLILKVFKKDKATLTEEQEKVLQERLSHAKRVSAPKKDKVIKVILQSDKADDVMDFRVGVAGILHDAPYIDSVILTKDGKPAEAAPAGPKPSASSSPEQKLVQDLASLEVNLKTLSQKI